MAMKDASQTSHPCTVLPISNLFFVPPPSLSLSLSLSLSCTDTHAGKENEKDENEERQKARRYLRLFGSLGAIGRDHAINRAIQPND